MGLPYDYFFLITFDGQVQTYLLPEYRKILYIGRGRNNDICFLHEDLKGNIIEDKPIYFYSGNSDLLKEISRIRASIIRISSPPGIEDFFFIYDKSRNGIYINNKKIVSRETIALEATIEIGKAKFVLKKSSKDTDPEGTL